MIRGGSIDFVRIFRRFERCIAEDAAMFVSMLCGMSHNSAADAEFSEEYFMVKNISLSEIHAELSDLVIRFRGLPHMQKSHEAKSEE